MAFHQSGGKVNLTTEPIKRPTLPLQRINDIQRSNRLPLRMFSISNRIANNTLQESLQYTTGFLVDHGRDTFDTAATGETTDCGLGYALDVVAQDLAVAFGTAFAEAFAAFAACVFLLVCMLG